MQILRICIFYIEIVESGLITMLSVLTQKGISVEYSRRNDTDVSLDGRAQQANNWGASLFVSIHANSNAGTPGTGTECYTYPAADAQNKQLSANVARAIANKFGIANRGHKVNDFAVLRLTNMPAILVETAFINNASDANLLRNRQADFVAAIANEILKYLGEAPGVDLNAFNKYSSNIGFFKGLGMTFTATSKVITTLSLVPHITLSGETSTEAKLSHTESVFNPLIDISKGHEGVANQLFSQLTTANIKIPFSKSELSASLTDVSLITEINDKISSSVKVLQGGVEVTLEAAFKYNSNVTGYQRFIITIERSLRHKYYPVPLRASANNPAYNTMPEYAEQRELPEGTPLRFKFPKVEVSPKEAMFAFTIGLIYGAIKILARDVAGVFLLK